MNLDLKGLSDRLDHPDHLVPRENRVLKASVDLKEKRENPVQKDQ